MRFKFRKRLCGIKGLGRCGLSGVIEIRSSSMPQLANREEKTEQMVCKIIRGSGLMIRRVLKT